MLPRTAYCQCCGRELPETQINMRRLDFVMCIHCELLPARDAAQMARDTANREATIQRATRDGRRRMRIAAKLASYEEHGKKCACCYAYKPVEEYDRCAPRPDGLQSNCRACNRLRLATVNQQGGQSLWRTLRDALRARSAALQAQRGAKLTSAAAAAGLDPGAIAQPTAPAE